MKIKKILDKDIVIPLPIIEIVVCLLLILIEVFYIIDSIPLNKNNYAPQVGPGGFPIGIGAISLFITTIFLIKCIANIKKKNNSRNVVFNRAYSVVVSIAIIIIAGGSLDKMGAFFGTWVLSALIMFFCNERGKSLLIIPPVFAASVYVLFVYILSVYFP